MSKTIFTYKDIQRYKPIQLLDAMGFDYDPAMKRATDSEIRAVCNGIGAKDSPFNSLIPNTIWGLDISLCSVPHDWDYKYGVVRLKADDRFYRNGLKLIEIKGGWSILKFLRRRRLWKYYEILRLAGSDAFEEGHKS